MLYKEFKLSRFFLLVFFLFVAILTFVLYGWRKNAPGNVYDEKGLDISSPYYDKEKTTTHSEYPVHEDPHAAPKGGEPDDESHDHEAGEDHGGGGH
jgi:hypothetical protein